jgi:PAS domain S-box-containing protein
MNFHGRPAYPIAFFATITLVIVTLSTSILLWDLRKRELAHTRAETIGMSKIFTEQTERSFESANLVLKGIQNRMAAPYANDFALNSIEVHLLLATRVLGMRQMDALYLLDQNGAVINSSAEHPVKKINVNDQDYFKAFSGGKDPGMFISKPVFVAQTKSWNIYAARKLVDQEGTFKGVIVGVIDIAHFEDVYKMLKLDYARQVSLYRDDGILIASYPHRENMIGDRAPELGETIPTLEVGKVAFVEHKKNHPENEVLVLSPVPKLPLFIAVANDEEEALASWRETAIPIVMSAVLVCLFIIGAAGLLIREAMRQQKLTDELGAAQNRYQHTIDSVMDAIIAVDEAQNIILFNPSAERMFGLEAKKVIGQPLSILLPERFRGAHNGHVQGFKKTDINSRTMGPQLGIVGLRSDGTEFPIESTISQTMINGQRQLTAVLRDVTERRKAENELREMNHQLRGLSEALEEIREQERTRIARELHDDLGQQLTGLKLELSWLASRIKEGRMPPDERIAEMKQQLDGAISSVRRISTELRPIILDDLGFAEAVKWLVGEFTKRTQIPVQLDLKAEVCVSNSELATALFRIVQESLTNVMRHAEATQVHIALEKTDEQLILTISDNGVGLPQDLKSCGFGLVGMRERAKALGAKFSINNNRLKGVNIRVEFDLDSHLFSEGNA